MTTGANEYKLFCTADPTGAANSLTPAAYAMLTTILADGYQTGEASSEEANTTWRQATMGTAACAQIIANSGQDALDDRSVPNFVAKLLAALNILLTQPHQAGDLKMVAGTGIPANWHRCDGTLLVRTDYPSLFSAIGLLYDGTVDADHFRLPDFRGYFPRGVDNGRGVDPGRSLGSAQADGFQSHFHVVNNLPGENRAQPGDIGDLLVSVPGSVSENTTNAGVPSETRPKNIAVNFLIFTGPIGS